jgi:hypothetical protein
MEPWKSRPHLADRCSDERCSHVRSSHYLVKDWKAVKVEKAADRVLYGSGCFACECKTFADPAKEEKKPKEKGCAHACLRGNLCCRCKESERPCEACAD